MAVCQGLKLPGSAVGTGAVPGTNFLQCRICSGVFVDPRLLDCQDTFCRGCIEKLLASGDGSSVKCPLCTALTKFPKTGIQSLSTNSFIVKLVELSHLEDEQMQQKLICSACCRSTTVNNVNSQQSTAAVVYCVDCDDKFCVDCQLAHAKFKPTQSHRLIPLGKDFVNKYKEANKNKASVCTAHEDHSVALYCKQCSKPICLMCAVLEHRTHDYADISQVATDRKAELTVTVKKLSAKRKSLKRLKWKMQENGKMLEANIRAIERTLNDRSADFKACLEFGLKYLQSDVDNKRKNAMSEVLRLENPIQSKRDAFKIVATYCCELLMWGRYADICEVVACRAESISSNVQNDVIGARQIVIAYSRPDASRTFGKASDTFGLVSVACVSDSSIENISHETSILQLENIEVQNNKSAEITKQKQLRSVHIPDISLPLSADVTAAASDKVGSIAGTQPVYGIAVVGDELLVAYRSNPLIHVYNWLTLVFKRHASVDGLVTPSDMAACDVKRNVYISDFTHRTVFCMHLDGTSSLKKQTMPSPWGISVMTNTHILVAQRTKHCFTECTADLQVIRTVNTPAYNPTHVIQIPQQGDQFLICERGNFGSPVTLLRVRHDNPSEAERLADSRLLATFKAVSHLLIDPKRSSIIIADRQQHAIFTANLTLTKYQPCHTGTNIKCPNKICTDSCGQILYIGINQEDAAGDAIVAFKNVHQRGTEIHSAKSIPSVEPERGISTHAKETTATAMDVQCVQPKSLDESQLIGRIYGTEPVHGLAVIADELYVVYRTGSVVHTYNRHTLVPRSAITVDGLSKPTDLAACSMKRRIYICDRTQQKLFSVSLDENNSIKSQSVITSGGISVTNVATVLVAQGIDSRFSEYSSELLLLRTIETPGYNPFHVVSLPSSTTADLFVICEGYRAPVRRITTFRVEMTQPELPDIVSVITDSSSTPATFKAPAHLVVDSQQNIIVIDVHLHELVTLSQTLSQVRSPIIDRKHTRGLYRACFDSSFQTLYIGTAGCPENGAVSAFKIVQ